MTFFDGFGFTPTVGGTAVFACPDACDDCATATCGASSIYADEATASAATDGCNDEQIQTGVGAAGATWCTTFTTPATMTTNDVAFAGTVASLNTTTGGSPCATFINETMYAGCTPLVSTGTDAASGFPYFTLAPSTTYEYCWTWGAAGCDQHASPCFRPFYAYPPAQGADCSNPISLVCDTPLSLQDGSTGGQADLAGCASGSDGLWYEFVGTGDDITITASNSTTDHEIAIWTTPDCAAFTNIACVDGSTGTETATITSSVLGTSYYIHIRAWNDGGTPPIFTIEATGCPVPCLADAGTNDAAASYIVCDGDAYAWVSNDDAVLPPPSTDSGGNTTAELGYALYNVAPPTSPDPDVDAGFTGSFWTGDDWSDSNPVGAALGGAGALVNANNTVWFVPITMDDGDGDADESIGHDNNGDGCFATGTPIPVTYLNPISETNTTSGCTWNVSLSGGAVEFSTFLGTTTEYTYNITPDAAAMANGATSATGLMTTGGGTVAAPTALADGTYTIAVTDDGNGCMYSFDVTLSTCPSCPTFTAAPTAPSVTDAACAADNVTLNAGAIDYSGTTCPAGSSLQYSYDDTDYTTLVAAPSYTDVVANGGTVYVRCQCDDINTTVSTSAASSPTTNPGTCPAVTGSIDNAATDPCACGNAGNIMVTAGDDATDVTLPVQYFIEVVSLTTMPAAAGLTITTTTELGVLNSSGVATPASFVEGPAGTYTATFYHAPGATGYSITGISANGGTIVWPDQSGNCTQCDPGCDADNGTLSITPEP